MTSVMMGRPVASRASARYSSPLSAQALEVVGAGARLEGAAAQHGGAGLLDGVGDLDDLFAALDAARAGHDDDLVAADAHLLPSTSMTVLSGRVVRLRQLVRLLDAHGVQHAFHWSKMSRLTRVRSPTRATTVRLSP